jgi:hypothetical protein
MNIIVASILAVAGILCLLFFRSLAGSFAAFMAKRFRESHGEYATERGWDNPNSQFNKYFYLAFVIFIGLFLLIMAFTVFFGPINLNR